MGVAFRSDSASTVNVCRYDIGTLGNFERTPQGGFRIPAFPTRVGVFPYRLPDGSMRREYRPAEEVLSPASLATLAHAPVTDLHPEQNGIRIPVTPENYKALAVGHIAEDVRPMSDHVAATALIQDQGMIQKIESGDRRECSAGYNCALDLTPGTTDQGEDYDVIQRNIRYNHVALGPRDWGRAGSTVALRLDSGDAIQAPQKETTVEKETINGVEYVVGSAEWRAAKNKLVTDANAARDLAQGRADAAEKAVKDARNVAPDPKVVQAAIIRRVRLVGDCKRAAAACKVRFDEEAAAAGDEQGLIVEAIKLLDPAFDPANRTPDYLAGYFASLIKGLGPATEADAAPDSVDPAQAPAPAPGVAPVQKTDSRATVFSAREGKGKGQERQDGGPDPDKARENMNKKNRDAWKQPLGKR